jgi:lactoylglutathione lyase
MIMRIDMLGIITSQFNEMKAFYRDVMGFTVMMEVGEDYVEFNNEGVRFALSTHPVMAGATGHPSYQQTRQGQSLELAFREDNPEAVDQAYHALIEKGATSIKAPANMPWGQRAGFFADPDGNIHEIFCDLTPES